MMRLNHSLPSLALTFFATIAAADSDPLLTEKSQQTFAIDFDGLTLSLPVELKSRVMAQAQDGKLLKTLEIGNVDFAFNQVKGWIEGEAFKSSCTAQKEMESIRKLLLSDGQDTIKVQHITNETFNGYIVNWTQASRGSLSGLALKLIDTQKSVCYTFSLAIEDFDGFTTKDIKDALAPLTGAIRKSLFSYANAAE